MTKAGTTRADIPDGHHLTMRNYTSHDGHRIKCFTKAERHPMIFSDCARHIIHRLTSKIHISYLKSIH